MYPYGQFADSMASSQTTVPLASPLSSRNSPKILSPSGLGPGRFPRQNSNESTGSRSSNDDELDKWGYLYSLRVACVLIKIKINKIQT
jgi:hypothetical protein